MRRRAQVHTATITYEQFKELYFQNPQFGFALLRLIVARLQGNAEVGQQAEVSQARNDFEPVPFRYEPGPVNSKN